MTGSVGPILGQNYGARLMDRVKRTMSDALTLSVGYALFAWAVLAFAGPAIAAMFDVDGEGATFIIFFCRYGVAAWLFVTCLFVANTVFNNLGYPLLAMLFNWGRATIGTIPFVVARRALGRRRRRDRRHRRRRGRVRPRRHGARLRNRRASRKRHQTELRCLPQDFVAI